MQKPKKFLAPIVAVAAFVAAAAGLSAHETKELIDGLWRSFGPDSNARAYFLEYQFDSCAVTGDVQQVTGDLSAYDRIARDGEYYPVVSDINHND